MLTCLLFGHWLDLCSGSPHLQHLTMLGLVYEFSLPLAVGRLPSPGLLEGHQLPCGREAVRPIWNLAEFLYCQISSLLHSWKVRLYPATSQSSRPCYGPHRQRIYCEGSHVYKSGTLTHWCTSQSAASPSEITRIMVRGKRTLLCMLTQSSYLTCNAHIDCRGSVDS